MYDIISIYPKQTEAEKAEIKAAAARAIYIALTQYIKEAEE